MIDTTTSKFDKLTRILGYPYLDDYRYTRFPNGRGGDTSALGVLQSLSFLKQYDINTIYKGLLPAYYNAARTVYAASDWGLENDLILPIPAYVPPRYKIPEYVPYVNPNPGYHGEGYVVPPGGGGSGYSPGDGYASLPDGDESGYNAGDGGGSNPPTPPSEPGTDWALIGLGIAGLSLLLMFYFILKTKADD